MLRSEVILSFGDSQTSLQSWPRGWACYWGGRALLGDPERGFRSGCHLHITTSGVSASLADNPPQRARFQTLSPTSSLMWEADVYTAQVCMHHVRVYTLRACLAPAFPGGTQGPPALAAWPARH